MCVQKRREREMQQQMESRDEETLELKETYTSLQQEVDIKTKKLKKVRMVVTFAQGIINKFGSHGYGRILNWFPNVKIVFVFMLTQKKKRNWVLRVLFCFLFLEAMILQYQPLTFKMNIEMEINESENKWKVFCFVTKD